MPWRLTEQGPVDDLPGITVRERSSWQAFGIVFVLLILLLLWVSAVYVRGWEGVPFASLFLSFLIPLTLAAFTMRKVFFVLGFGIFGAILVIVGTIATAQGVTLPDPLDVRPATQLPGPIGILFGLLSLYVAYYITRWG